MTIWQSRDIQGFYRDHYDEKLNFIIDYQILESRKIPIIDFQKNNIFWITYYCNNTVYLNKIDIKKKDKESFSGFLFIIDETDTYNKIFRTFYYDDFYMNNNTNTPNRLFYKNNECLSFLSKIKYNTNLNIKYVISKDLKSIL